MDSGSLPSYCGADLTQLPHPTHRRWVPSFGFLVVTVIVLAITATVASSVVWLYSLGPLGPDN